MYCMYVIYSYKIEKRTNLHLQANGLFVMLTKNS